MFSNGGYKPTYSDFYSHLKKMFQKNKCTNKWMLLNNNFSLFFCSFSEIARIQSGGKPPGRDSKFVDIYHEKPIRLTVRALVPVKEHPKVSLRSLTHSIWQIQLWCPGSKWNMGEILAFLAFWSKFSNKNNIVITWRNFRNIFPRPLFII